MILSEQQHLVRRVLEYDDQQAATTLYYYLLPRVVSALWRFDPNNLEEYTQLAMIRIFAKLSTWRGDASLSTWCYRVARNVALMEIRKPKPIEVSTSDFEPGYSEPRFDTIDRFKLRIKIAELPSSERSTTLLRLQGFKYCEIAVELGITIGAAKNYAHRAKRHLQRIMLDA